MGTVAVTTTAVTGVPASTAPAATTAALPGFESIRSRTVQPRFAEQEAVLLNRLYMGFNSEDNASPLGVIISMAAQLDSFDDNIYCAPVVGSGCWNGNADCRMSASLYNHKILLDAQRPNRISVTMNRCVGYVFDQDMVESEFGKCYYAWDGATNNRYNNGCGMGAPGSDCSKDGTAFQNICPSTGKICNADDSEVKRSLC